MPPLNSTFSEVDLSRQCRSAHGHAGRHRRRPVRGPGGESKDAHARPTVTVDGVPGAVHEVETGLLRITLPDDNLFGLPAATDGLSVAHGWVTLLHPLTPGTHTIVVKGSSPAITTEITVLPGRPRTSR